VLGIGRRQAQRQREFTGTAGRFQTHFGALDPALALKQVEQGHQAQQPQDQRGGQDGTEDDFLV
jgi:hypothetical protein